MKSLYTTALGLILLFSFQLSQAQTYNLNTAANPAVGGVCPANTGIDNTYDCAFDNAPAITLGSFTDTNPGGSVLNTMEIVAYAACSGDVEFFINGVSFFTGSSGPGLSCSCQSIAGDPLIPQNYTVTVTPAMQAAFVAGGVNTLTVAGTNSAVGAQCFYGADVILTAGPAAAVPTMSQWGLIILGLVVVCIGGVTIWNRRNSTAGVAVQ